MPSRLTLRISLPAAGRCRADKILCRRRTTFNFRSVSRSAACGLLGCNPRVIARTDRSLHPHHQNPHSFVPPQPENRPAPCFFTFRFHRGDRSPSFSRHRLSPAVCPPTRPNHRLRCPLMAPHPDLPHSEAVTLSFLPPLFRAPSLGNPPSPADPSVPPDPLRPETRLHFGPGPKPTAAPTDLPLPVTAATHSPCIPQYPAANFARSPPRWPRSCPAAFNLCRSPKGGQSLPSLSNYPTPLPALTLGFSSPGVITLTPLTAPIQSPTPEKGRRRGPFPRSPQTPTPGAERAGVTEALQREP